MLNLLEIDGQQFGIVFAAGIIRRFLINVRSKIIFIYFTGLLRTRNMIDIVFCYRRRISLLMSDFLDTVHVTMFKTQLIRSQTVLFRGINLGFLAKIIRQFDLITYIVTG